MAKIYIKKHNEEDAGNIFWVTMSDLMLGLAIIFITMFVFAMTGFTQSTVQQQQEKMVVTQKIESELQKANINASVDKITGDIQIPATSLFSLNSYVLTNEGKKLLDKLAPIYVNTVFGNQNLAENIENIYIQGFTDSQTFAGINSKEEQFMKNMELSLKRAQVVAEYILKTGYNKKYSEKLRQRIVVEGNSSNHPVLVNGVEDYAKSRRVEIKLEVKDWSVASAFGIKK